MRDDSSSKKCGLFLRIDARKSPPPVLQIYIEDTHSLWQRERERQSMRTKGDSSHTTNVCPLSSSSPQSPPLSTSGIKLDAPVLAARADVCDRQLARQEEEQAAGGAVPRSLSSRREGRILFLSARCPRPINHICCE